MNFLFDGPDDSPDVIVLAHGAGGAMDTPFMNNVARDLASRDIRVVRFEFPYMSARRTGGKRGAPDREPVLLDSWRAVVHELGGGAKLIIGGKSMGGRMASMVADDLSVRGLICLGYPFHPPGAPEKLRTKHLAELRTPTLIVQGERDPFGTRDDVAGYRLSDAIRVEWVPDGDHSFKPRAASGHTEKQNVERACASIHAFVTALH
jgi:predicted alpha/beta-hydrolase family hydrolase